MERSNSNHPLTTCSFWNASPVNNIEEGYRLGQLGLALQEKFRVRVWFSRVALLYWLGIHTCKHPLNSIFAPHKDGQRVGIETGDIESSLACGLSHDWCRFETTPLPEVEAAYHVLREQMIFYGQETSLAMTKPFLQLVHNLMGRGHGGPTTLTGEIMDKKSLRDLQKANGKTMELANFYLMLLAYMFGDHDKVAAHSMKLRPASDYPFGAMEAALIVFFDGLVAVKNARISQRRKMLRLAQKQLRRIRHWAQHAPHTFLCRQFLLEAEVAAVKGHHVSVYSTYVAAIAQARDAGFIFQIALGNELAGKHYLFERNDTETALPFLREAVYHYERWGAKAKVEHLTLELKQIRL